MAQKAFQTPLINTENHIDTIYRKKLSFTTTSTANYSYICMI